MTINECTKYELVNIANRQQAEIEKWKAEYTRACAERDARICTQDYFKSEAIKEFAELIVADYPEMEFYLDNLVKEMEVSNYDYTESNGYF